VGTEESREGWQRDKGEREWALVTSGVSTRDKMWRPRFLISIISANDRINWVKPADVGQTLVNLGHHLENLVNNN
jgi:hypothetical protein